MPNPFKTRLDREIASIVKRSRSKHQFFPVKVNSYSEFITNKQAIFTVIREGLPYSFFSVIRDASPFSENDWSDLLDMSTKSLQRYKQADRQFKPSQSEKIIEMAEVIEKGVDTFGDLPKFKLWLETPNFSLGNVKPIELLRNSFGKDMVIAELTRIDHGILA